MTITLLVVGKTDIPFVREGIALYEERLRHYTHFAIEVIPLPKEARSGTPESIKRSEGAQILRYMEKSDYTVLLDEHGKQYTSVAFSNYLQQRMNAGVRRLTFVVGGAYGFAPEVYARAQDQISLSAMTFNHQMVRLFFTEQLYRAFTILHHEKYHNE